jgi:hypothetical protein
MSGTRTLRSPLPGSSSEDTITVPSIAIFNDLIQSLSSKISRTDLILCPRRDYGCPSFPRPRFQSVIPMTLWF